MSIARDRFRRYLLPGLAFKAVIIGGGYATGREIAEFFLPAGPWGGLAAMLLATMIWALVAAATFHFAYKTGARDYRHFFQALLGRAWVLFEVAYAVFIVLILSVFGAAAGAIAAATLGLPPLVGTLALMFGIVACVAFGNAGVERVFVWVSVLLYATYAVFFLLMLAGVGDKVVTAFDTLPSGDWALGGVTYAGYNVIGAVIVLSVTRHFRSGRDAVVAGLIAGPLAMLPAMLFFVGMMAFMPEIAGEVLPSDYMLVRLGHPVFHLIFQFMIFAALLESGTGAVHAVNERLARTRGVTLTPAIRAAAALALLVPCMLIADRIGLVTLIASGYRAIAWAIIVIYVVPLLVVVVLRRAPRPVMPQPEPS
ncbi:YkvI family membrane protein [Sphingomonas sp. SRS2]|uniref:YkvI family membrane protein n=1 Tax=Sphingomonas sp. SRS2 TaxID=133190 RepID=UPI00061845F4|nr:membrane protein [Sphingomonas sp. SRS2]KKC26046.1 membrane protein [Sphingomonas sp. SRS2]